MGSAIVIGSGFSGLASACYLAKAGVEVTVLEKNTTLGGRARHFQAEGFTFDMGPSWYWMPDIFERFFADFDKSVSDYYELVRLDPSYQVFFTDGSCVQLPADMKALEQTFEEIEAGSAHQLRKFLEDAQYKYEVGIQEFVEKPGHSIFEFADFRVVTSLFRLQMFKSISKEIRQKFKHPKLRQLLEFPVLFLGATPENTPALYSLMNYADMSLGTWYPKGGMSQIVQAMTKLARSLGVKFITDAEVMSIETDGHQVSEVKTIDKSYTAAHIVASADYAHVEQSLLHKEHRNYSDQYWDSRTMAPSSLLFYLGVDQKVDGLLHHNLFFDADFAKHANEIYESPKWPTDPLFYVCCPSKTDATVAPDGMENIFLLLPLAPDLDDSDALRQQYFDLMMDRLEEKLSVDIRSHIVYQRSYCLKDFKQDYHAYKGNAYGLANTLLQTAFLKPKLKNRSLKNLYFTGQLTTPGPGVPPSIISGRVVAGEILKSIKTRA